MEIEVRTQSKKFRYPVQPLRRAAARMLRILGKERASLSILLTEDRLIRRLNRDYLGHDRPTDVLAFPYGEGMKGGLPLLGDLVISVETAYRQAHEHGTTLDYEIHLYLCHGILHLLGYRDKKKRERHIMGQKQEQVLKRIGIWPSKKQKPLS